MASGAVLRHCPVEKTVGELSNLDVVGPPESPRWARLTSRRRDTVAGPPTQRIRLQAERGSAKFSVAVRFQLTRVYDEVRGGAIIGAAPPYVRVRSQERAVPGDGIA